MKEEEFEKNCKEIIEEYGRKWDIKPHILAGSLWWKEAMKEAYYKGIQEGRKETKQQLREVIEKYKGDYRSLIVNDFIKEVLNVI